MIIKVNAYSTATEKNITHEFETRARKIQNVSGYKYILDHFSRYADNGKISSIHEIGRFNSEAEAMAKAINLVASYGLTITGVEVEK